MDDINIPNRPLPLYLSMPGTAAFIVLLFVLLNRTASAAMRFVIFAIWARLMMSANHQITFESSPIGLSWNALGSIALFFLGLLVIRKRPLLVPVLVPIYLMAIVVFLSGMLNGALGGMIAMLVKYGYLAVLILAVMDALEDIGAERFFKLVIWPFAVPFGFQFLSIVGGIYKQSEGSGSAAYVGGYPHEAIFSVGLSAGLLVVCLARGIRPAIKAPLVLYGFFAITMANYRTAILAMGPLVLAVMFTGGVRRFVPRDRALATGAMALVIAAAIATGVLAGQDRFADLGVVAEQGGQIIQPPGDFDREEQRLLSARPYIWSMYYYGWKESSDLQHLVGLGPDAWLGVFKKYAHNTLFSYIYELGVFGVAAVLFLWAFMAALALRTAPDVRPRLIAAHFSFFLLNMSTMPLWQIEGMIFYGLLCGYTASCANEARFLRRSAVLERRSRRLQRA